MHLQELSSISRSYVVIVFVTSGLISTLNGQEKVDWTPAKQLTVEGQHWQETKSPFDRLPPAAESTVRAAVWGLSRHSAGICIRFRTDAEEIHAKWKLISSRLAMPHMTATGVSGLDLYVRAEGGWMWLGAGQPKEQENRVTLAKGLAPAMREYLLYLPLYNGVAELEVGVPSGATMEPGDERPQGHKRPIVFYGTSITQGGCASRPGMVHTAILGRWFDRPVINLGFSGNGKMEESVVQFMEEIDAAVFVIDCLPNMVAAQVSERTAPLVERLRKRHPNTPILLVEDRNYSNNFLIQRNQQRNQTNQAALKTAFDKLTKGGVKHLHYLEGKGMLGADNEGTVDSSHPTDLGFYRQALAFRDALAPLLPAPGKSPEKH